MLARFLQGAGSRDFEAFLFGDLDQCREEVFVVVDEERVEHA